jgi:hypothetical protein
MGGELSRSSLSLIEERIISLERSLHDLLAGKGGGPVADSGFGCCSKEGCCEKQGCCGRTKLEGYDEDLMALGKRFGLPVDVLIERISKLDPKLLGAKGRA